MRFSILGKLEKKEKEKGDKVGVDARVRLYLQTGGKFVSERAKEAQKDLLVVNTVWWVKKVCAYHLSFTSLLIRMIGYEYNNVKQRVLCVTHLPQPATPFYHLTAVLLLEELELLYWAARCAGICLQVEI